MTEFPFIDLHCDTANNYVSSVRHQSSGIRWAQQLTYDFLAKDNDPMFMVDLPSMKQAGFRAGIFAVHAPLVYDGNSLCRVLSLAENFTQIIEGSDGIDVVYDRESLRRQVHKADIAVLLSIENGDVFNRDVNMIHALFRYGFRVCTLAWYGRNCICDAGHESENVGLSWFGRQAVQEMRNLGMLIDISHMNRAGSLECLDITDGNGVFASHSNCRAICKAERNLTDEVLKLLGQADSCVGITFVPGFLSEGHRATIEDVVRHIEHAVHLMGIDHVAIGTDFDGTTDIVNGLERIDKIHHLIEQLEKFGFQAEDIHKIMWRNALRFLDRHLPDSSL